MPIRSVDAFVTPETSEARPLRKLLERADWQQSRPEGAVSFTGFPCYFMGQMTEPVAHTPYRAFSLRLDSLRKANAIPGLAASIVRNQELVWAEGFGASHFNQGDAAVYRSVTPHTPFWIASVTKTFVGLAFLQLDEQGVISLDDAIDAMPRWAEFCQWLANSGIIFGENLPCDKPITIRHILNHTVNGEPGTRFFYNPIMYSRLSRYLEYRLGNPIDQAEKGHNALARFIQANILAPAGMTRTMASQWQADKPEVFFDMAEGYAYQDGRYIKMRRPDRHLPGGAGIVSTVRDLSRYDIALDTYRLGDENLMGKLFSPPIQDGVVLPYAFGWYVQSYQGKKLIWHAGWDEEAGFSALLLKIPEDHLTLILLANSEGLWWGNPLDKAAVHQSAFAQLFFETFLTF